MNFMRWIHQGFMHVKALDIADRDKAFALGFGICRGWISEKLDDLTAYSALEKAFVPCFKNSTPGARGAACEAKGSICAEAKNFSAHAYVYKNQEQQNEQQYKTPCKNASIVSEELQFER